MKHISFEPLKEWFGYTRRERRSTFILLLLIAAIAGIRFIVPGRNITVEMLPSGPSEIIPDTTGRKNITTKNQFYRQVRYNKPAKLVDINTCDSASLEALPGLGPVLSARIIKYRNLLGGYAAVSQLKEVYGLSEETYNLISGMLVADPGDIKKININNADYKRLIRLPYFERYDVSAILKYRELKSMVESIEELVENKIITPEKAEKVKYYFEFGDN